MKGKIIAILVIINLILVGEIYNLINKENVNNQKKIIKEMSETEYEEDIISLNTSHEEYVNYIKESKKKIATALTEMGVETSNDETLETMANNIKIISSNNSNAVMISTESSMNRYYDSLFQFRVDCNIDSFSNYNMLSSIENVNVSNFMINESCQMTINGTLGNDGWTNGTNPYIYVAVNDIKTTIAQGRNVSNTIILNLNTGDKVQFGFVSSKYNNQEYADRSMQVSVSFSIN